MLYAVIVMIHRMMVIFGYNNAFHNLEISLLMFYLSCFNLVFSCILCVVHVRGGLEPIFLDISRLTLYEHNSTLYIIYKDNLANDKFLQLHATFELIKTTM